MVGVCNVLHFAGLPLSAGLQIKMLLACFLYILWLSILRALLQISGTSLDYSSMTTSPGKWDSIPFRWWQQFVISTLPMMSAKINTDRRSKHLSIQQSFFEYVAYVFMFSNLLIGPIPCRSFIEFLRLEGDYKNIKYLHRPWIITLIKAIAFMVGEVLIRPRLDDKMF